MARYGTLLAGCFGNCSIEAIGGEGDIPSVGCLGLLDGSVVDFYGQRVQSEAKRCALFSDWVLPSAVRIMLLRTLYLLVRGALGLKGCMDVLDGVGGRFSRLVLVQFEEYCFLV